MTTFSLLQVLSSLYPHFYNSILFHYGFDSFFKKISSHCEHFLWYIISSCGYDLIFCPGKSSYRMVLSLLLSRMTVIYGFMSRSLTFLSNVEYKLRTRHEHSRTESLQQESKEAKPQAYFIQELCHFFGLRVFDPVFKTFHSPG